MRGQTLQSVCDGAAHPRILRGLGGSVVVALVCSAPAWSKREVTSHWTTNF